MCVCIVVGCGMGPRVRAIMLSRMTSIFFNLDVNRKFIRSLSHSMNTPCARTKTCVRGDILLNLIERWMISDIKTQLRVKTFFADFYFLCVNTKNFRARARSTNISVETLK